MKTLFIFRRDLRTVDNTGLIESSRQGRVIPIFIFDPRQQKGGYRSQKAFSFMLESLEELPANTYSGLPHEVIREFDVDRVAVNMDYTPFSRKRDDEIAAACRKMGIGFHSYDDCLLNGPEDVMKKDGKPYTVFTPFFRRASGIPVREPENMTFRFSAKKELPEFERINLGGRKKGLRILERISDFSNYEKTKDFPSIDTTRLSAHLKFGTISAREAFHAISSNLGADHPLIRQLYWRDFFTHIAFHFPHVFGSSFHKKFDRIKWGRKGFEKWCRGETGFPIVDAAMRELNKTGFMHNRMRMVAGSFLVKDLHVDWRLGERYFATRLVDYDPSLNNGNWQWVASTGCDSQPYYRIFNPWLQQKRFDPECAYIKKWLPELKELDPVVIHDSREIQKRYIPQIVDHSVERKKALSLWNSYLNIAKG